MSSQEHQFRCSRCFREAPAVDSDEILAWGVGDPEIVEFLDETTAYLLVCPECREEVKSDEELGGESG